MADFIVRTPVEGYNGKVGDDVFVDGLCESPSKRNLAYYRRHGYTIEGEPSAEESGEATAGESDVSETESLARPEPKASKADWVAYAEHIGAPVSADFTKDEVVAAVAARETAAE